MKKIASILLALSLSVAAFAQTVGMSPFGYGAAATGGGNATPTLVTDKNSLKTALESSGSQVIIITQNITFTSVLSVKATNKTLMALPGVKLISNQQNKDNSGILYFSSGSSNLILRNLTFEGPGAYDCDGWDLLCFDGVTKAWVDHCDFQDGCDGNFDNKGKTDNITVSWCRFRYLKPAKAGGPGGSNDHRFSNLLGSSSSDKPSDGIYNMTWAYCWWDNGCKERMLRCRNASLHFLNCLWDSNVANYYVGPENADCRFDGCTFRGAPAQNKIFYENYGGKNGSLFTSCVSKNGVPANVTTRTVATIPYPYNTLNAGTAEADIRNSQCGAGATLTVTTTGQVSSSCEGPDPGPESCYDLTAAPSLPSGMVITVNDGSPTYDATNGIVLGLNDDYFCVDVSGMNATIVSAKVTVKTGSQDVAKGFVYGTGCATGFTGTNVLNTATSFTEYNLTGINSQVLSIRRKGTGTNINRICLTLDGDSPTPVIETPVHKEKKVLMGGHLYLIRDGIRYDATGRVVR